MSTICLSEVGIYKLKQESKKTRKQELDQENDQEKRNFYKFPPLFRLCISAAVVVLPTSLSWWGAVLSRTFLVVLPSLNI